MAPFNGQPTEAEQKALVIIPKFSAALSLMGSGFIVYDVLRRGKNTVYHRLLLGLSTCDLLASAAWFLTSWPVPEGSPHVWGAKGNTQTCTAQGFFTQLSLSTVMYNASLSLYYLLQIRYGWTDDRIRRTGVNISMHVFSMAMGLGTSTASIFLTLFNNAFWDCWISPLPLDCQQSYKNNGVTTCERGDNATLYQWVFYYAPMWFVIFLVTVFMAMVYDTVLRHERASNRYHFGGRNRRHKKSRRVAAQALCYVGAFYITWLFPTITRLVQLIGDVTYYPLILLSAISVPIQGFMNFFVYIRPRYLRVMKRSSQNVDDDDSPPTSAGKLAQVGKSIRAVKDVVMNDVTVESSVWDSSYVGSNPEPENMAEKGWEFGEPPLERIEDVEEKPSSELIENSSPKQPVEESQGTGTSERRVAFEDAD